MATLGVDGLISGLDTTSLINQLMTAEAAPQTLLKTKQTATTSLVTALQSLNTKVASLAAAATKAATASSWSVTKATASAASVTASTTSAQPTQLSFTVDKVASAQVSLTDGYADLASLVGSATSVTIRAKDGTTTEIPVGSSLSGLANAITASGAGVNASAVTVNGITRLQLTGTQTGTNSSFDLFVGPAADITSSSQPVNVSTLRSASDAQITLWPEAGAGVSQVVTSGSNTFSGVLSGASITVSAVEASPVTLTIARDSTAVTALASGVVSALGSVLTEISTKTAATTTTDADGRTIVTGGIYSSDSNVRGLQQAIQQAASYPVDGVSPSSVGINVDRDGAFTFDSDKFAAALAADPAQVQKVVSTLAQRVADAANGASDKYSGSLTLEITGQQQAVKDLGTEIADWDVRLALRRDTLQATYSALEVTLSGLKSQSTWLAGQLNSLPSSSNSSN